jgi:hypothetical protein
MDNNKIKTTDKNMDKNKITKNFSPEGRKSRIYTNYQADSGETLRVTAESTSCGYSIAMKDCNS